jgi:hypothetical protein
VHRVLLALADIGLGIQLQEALEGRGVPVRWDPGAALGPAAAHLEAAGDLEDVVIVDADGLGDRLPEVVAAWRTLDPPPALLALGASEAAARTAAQARCQLVAAGDDPERVLDAADAATRLRLAGTMSRGVARRALGLAPVADPIADAGRILAGARELPVELAREALRWHARSYVCADEAAIAALREARALTIPEVEQLAHLDGTLTVQRVVKAGPLDSWQAARLLWALTSIGAARITPEPCDLATPRRRALGLIRRHLRARQARLARATLYDVLEVIPAAEDDVVEAACQGVAHRYAPAVLAGFDLADLAGLVEPTWQQVEKARAVMYDMAARGRYQDWLRARGHELRSHWMVGAESATAAAAAWARGQHALGAGDVHRAVGELAAAARHHPGHPDYEANLAWARYRVGASRDGADRAALARRERAAAEASYWGCRPWPRAMLALALLSAADDDAEAARWHLQEALAIDPHLPAARALLTRLARR